LSTRQVSAMAAVDYLKKTSRLLKAMKVVVTVLGALLIALSPWLASQEEWRNAERISDIIFMVGLAMTVIGSIVLIFIDDLAPDTIASNIRLEQEVSLLKERFGFYEAYQNHLLARISVNAQVRELVETASLDRASDSDALSKYASAIVSIFVERRNVLFGIGDEY
jgi:L-lactate permease